MAQRIFSSAAIAVLVLLASSPAQARRAGGYFGADEKMHVIAPSGVKAEGTALSICYKSYTYYILAGLYTTSDLVLCEGEGATRYYPMPSGATLASLQRDGLLPTPLPGYSRNWTEYAAGYSLWLLLMAGAIVVWFSSRRQKAEAENNARLIRLMARRIMARMIAGAEKPEAGQAVAANVFRGLFNEPLPMEEIAADMRWVADSPAAYEGFLKAMSRKLDGKSKALLLRAAAYVVMADGCLTIGETQSLQHLATCLGVPAKDVEDFIATLAKTSTAHPSA